MPSVKEIVTEYLRLNSYDGLAGEDCGCARGKNFMPCGEYGGECVAGHKEPCKPDECYAEGVCDFHVVPGPKPTAAKEPAKGGGI